MFFWRLCWDCFVCDGCSLVDIFGMFFVVDKVVVGFFFEFSICIGVSDGIIFDIIGNEIDFADPFSFYKSEDPDVFTVKKDEEAPV